MARTKERPKVPVRKFPETRLEIPSQHVLHQLLSDPLPLELRATTLERSFHRDIYFDSQDHALESRGVQCRIRIRSDDTRVLSIDIRGTIGGATRGQTRELYLAEVVEVEAADALRGTSEPARRLRAIVDPSRLSPTIELECERNTRRARRGWLPLWDFEIVYDLVTVRSGDSSESFREMKIRHLRRRTRYLDALVGSLQIRYALRTTLSGKLERARKYLAALETQMLTRAVHDNREVTVIATRRGEIALRRDGSTLVLPADRGSGEDACRHLLRSHLGTAQGEVKLLGTAHAVGARPPLEVWLAADLPRSVESPANDWVRWFTMSEVMNRVGSPLLRDARTLAALAVASRSGLFPSTGEYPVAAPAETSAPARPAPDPGTQTLSDLPPPALPEESLDTALPVPEQFVNEELSWLEFNMRVLEMAEDPGTPLLARFRFLAIFSSNLDEFVMVRVGKLKHDVAQGAMDTSIDGLTAQQQLDAISVRLSPLVRRQQRCFRNLVPELARNGVTLRRWSDLTEGQRDTMKAHFDDQIFPVLTPQAVTQAPGHPFPHIPNLSLSLAVMVRDQESGSVHFANIRLPSGTRRFVPIPGTNDLIPIEEVIGANVGALYPGHLIEEVRAFRITRSGDISVDEEGASNLLQAIEEGVKRRPFGTVVRMEVDREMPQEMRNLLERELDFESSGQLDSLSNADVFEVDGLVDLTSLNELASLPRPELDYPRFEGGAPLDAARSIFEQIAERDILLYHPYESFESTVERFIVDAASDPDVVAIKLTLYRSGSQSRIIEALTRAARAGKEVAVFVELKARFDEERNIHWAKKLEQAGIHVVYGFVRLKTHAKTTLVVRREGDVVRRYVHVGTGNYNAATAKFYTDLGLLTCRRRIGADLNDLFNEFTGSSRAPRSKFQRLLVAPRRMRKQFLKLIEREAEHAKAGRGGRIRLKFNGLADKEMIGALYWASQAGVEIDLIIRGICALRPGVPGLSDRIRVFSLLGRFLEHARIYHFANGGDPEYYIGSADWRPRNLRRRVEVVAPVTDPDACARLDRILETELDDPYAWQMNADGAYSRPPAAIGVERRSAQEYWTNQLGRQQPDNQ